MATGTNKLVVTMDYIDESGESAAEVVATYKLLDYPGVVKMQGAIVGTLQGLGEAAVQAKAA